MIEDDLCEYSLSEDSENQAHEKESIEGGQSCTYMFCTFAYASGPTVD